MPGLKFSSQRDVLSWWPLRTVTLKLNSFAQVLAVTPSAISSCDMWGTSVLFSYHMCRYMKGGGGSRNTKTVPWIWLENSISQKTKPQWTKPSEGNGSLVTRRGQRSDHGGGSRGDCLKLYMTETAKIINCTFELVWFYNLNTKLHMVTITFIFCFTERLGAGKNGLVSKVLIEQVGGSEFRWFLTRMWPYMTLVQSLRARVRQCGRTSKLQVQRETLSQKNKTKSRKQLKPHNHSLHVQIQTHAYTVLPEGLFFFLFSSIFLNRKIRWKPHLSHEFWGTMEWIFMG